MSTLVMIGKSRHVKLVEIRLIIFRLGVGGILPKDIADGSFTKRTTISNDKLLEQLIGKKKAKAHLANKQQAERAGPQEVVPKSGRRPVAKKEESDDEEEGRAAAFKSKRRRVGQPKQNPMSDQGLEADEDAPEAPELKEDGKEPEAETKMPQDDEDSDAAPSKAKSKPLPSRGRAKPTSYLDEILAERSKKKQNKAKNKSSG